MKTALHTKNAPDTIGPYSQAVEDRGLVFCSGQIGLDPATGAIVEGGIETQTRRALESLRAVLGEAGLGFGDVLKTTIFMVDLADFTIVNRVYGEHFAPPFPARSTVQVAALPRGAKIEIEAIAIKRT
ncbi:MAG TPA: RidA family protein [Candidatus Binataceae bacterium]|nr:RidA family protein [Candidatus Binataceae bacterium]